MALYAIMGVQLFGKSTHTISSSAHLTKSTHLGRMDYHCVLSGTDPRNVTIADLAIPDTMCSQKGEGECGWSLQSMEGVCQVQRP